MKAKPDSAKTGQIHLIKSTKHWFTQKFSRSYTLYGITFGLFFPILATSIDLYINDLSFTMENIIQLQLMNPAHWLVDMIPLIFAVSYYFIGVRSDELNSERKLVLKRTKELEEAYRKLKKLDRHKDNFLSNVSHELRTPLTSIKSYVQMLDKGILGKINGEQKEGLDIILHSTNHLIELINDLLDSSRYEAGKAKLNFEESDVEEVLGDVIKEFTPTLKDIGGDINLTMEDNIGSVVLDQIKILQLIRNIINNSIKYRSESDLKIDINVSRDEQYLKIQLRDNGIGISEENRKHLFDKFYQVDQSLTKKVEGTGLGLSIVLQIIKAHKGKIEVNSKLGVYTEFNLFISTSLKGV